MTELYRIGQTYKFQTKKGITYTGKVTIETSDNVKIENNIDGEVILLKDQIEIARPVMNRTETENGKQKKF